MTLGTPARWELGWIAFFPSSTANQGADSLRQVGTDSV